MKTPASELYPSIVDVYHIDLLEEGTGRIHPIKIELPHLTKNNTFIINGKQYVIINQIVTYPIFFFKPFYGQFTSCYSTFTIHSKHIKKSSYLIGHITGYKGPLITILSCVLGFKGMCDLFGISYTISNKKHESGLYIDYSAPTEEAEQLMNGLLYLTKYFPKNKEKDFEDIDFWKETLANYTETRNTLYLIETTWKNIVTPIEKEVLRAKGDPDTIEEITKYICSGVVEGRVDDRNSLEKQRVRTSEVFSSLIFKQINASYNEFLSKRLGGDENATMQFNSTKVYSEVINSQNVQLLENINPFEEISMLTRVTPIGIGGVPDKNSITEAARNIHPSYYGNIDPLETPNSDAIGIQQHLTLGASIINARGQFALKNPELTKGVEILSVGPACIPFVNNNDGCRVTMGAAQMKQAVPLLHAEIPAVQTGFEAVLPGFLSDNFIKRSPVDGKIIHIDENIIKIKSKENKIVGVDIRSVELRSGQGKHGLSIFKPTVKIGQEVSAGTMIAEGSGIKNGIVSTGRNMLVAFMPWKGYNFEDAVVISESAAKKFSSVHMQEEVIYLQEDDELVYITSIGSEHKKGDILLTYSTFIEDVESYKHLRTDGGKVFSIEVYANTDNIPERLIPTYNNFKKTYIDIYGSYPQGNFKEKGVKFEGIKVRFVLHQTLPLIKGDKMNNRFFNKGVVSVIEPDENMPITPWGERVEMILNPLGVINRMNNGQIMELSTGLISWKLAQLMKSLPRDKFMLTYKKVLQELDRTKDKRYSKRQLTNLNSLSDKAYMDVVKEVEEMNFLPIIVPPFESPKNEDIIKAMSYIGLEPSVHLDIPGFGKTKEKVSVGYIYVQKLEHMATKKIKVRSTGPYSSISMLPAGGKVGQARKVSESDLYSLLSWDVPHVIEEFFGALSNDHVTKNEIVSNILNRGEASFKPAKSNPTKEMLSSLMLAIHLTSQ